MRPARRPARPDGAPVATPASAVRIGANPSGPQAPQQSGQTAKQVGAAIGCAGRVQRHHLAGPVARCRYAASDATETLIASAIATCRFPLSASTQPLDRLSPNYRIGKDHKNDVSPSTMS
jgi:hypothetical protein